MKWQPVEVLPLEPDENVVFEQLTLIVTNGERVTTCDFNRGNGAGRPWAEWSQYGDMNPQEITHYMRMPEPPPCCYCDGTGDVHDQTGEWRGTCACPAGQNPSAL